MQLIYVTMMRCIRSTTALLLLSPIKKKSLPLLLLDATQNTRINTLNNCVLALRFDDLLNCKLCDYQLITSPHTPHTKQHSITKFSLVSSSSSSDDLHSLNYFFHLFIRTHDVYDEPCGDHHFGNEIKHFQLILFFSIFFFHLIFHIKNKKCRKKKFKK